MRATRHSDLHPSTRRNAHGQSQAGEPEHAPDGRPLQRHSKPWSTPDSTRTPGRLGMSSSRNGIRRADAQARGALGRAGRHRRNIGSGPARVSRNFAVPWRRSKGSPSSCSTWPTRSKSHSTSSSRKPTPAMVPSFARCWACTPASSRANTKDWARRSRKPARKST